MGPTDFIMAVAGWILGTSPLSQECQAPAPLFKGKPTNLGQKVNKTENAGGQEG